MISFKARLVNQTTVRKIIPTGIDKTCGASLIQLDSACIKDLELMERVSNEWGYLDTYAYDVKSTMSKEFYLPKYRNSSQKEFYALTLQERGFNNPEYEKILGVMQVDKANMNKLNLDFIQVNPRHQFGCANAEYKNIGKSMIFSLLLLTQAKFFALNSVGKNSAFYEKLGFKKILNTTRYIIRNTK